MSIWIGAFYYVSPTSPDCVGPSGPDQKDLGMTISRLLRGIGLAFAVIGVIGYAVFEIFWKGIVLFADLTYIARGKPVPKDWK